MPISYRVDTDKNILWTDSTGTVTVTEIVEFYQKIPDIEGLQPYFLHITSLDCVKKTNVTVGGSLIIEEAAKETQRRLPRDFNILVATTEFSQRIADQVALIVGKNWQTEIAHDDEHLDDLMQLYEQRRKDAISQSR